MTREEFERLKKGQEIDNEIKVFDDRISSVEEVLSHSGTHSTRNKITIKSGYGYEVTIEDTDKGAYGHWDTKSKRILKEYIKELKSKRNKIIKKFEAL